MADIYDALVAKRPYRDAMPLDKVFGIIQKDAPRALDAQCVDALMAAVSRSEPASTSLLELSRHVGVVENTTKPEEVHATNPAPLR